MTYEKYTDISDQTAAAAVLGAEAYCRANGLPIEGAFDVVHESLAYASGDAGIVRLIAADPEGYGWDAMAEQNAYQPLD
jgi:hypothetical protein